MAGFSKRLNGSGLNWAGWWPGCQACTTRPTSWFWPACSVTYLRSHAADNLAKLSGTRDTGLAYHFEPASQHTPLSLLVLGSAIIISHVESSLLSNQRGPLNHGTNVWLASPLFRAEFGVSYRDVMTRFSSDCKSSLKLPNCANVWPPITFILA